MYSFLVHEMFYKLLHLNPAKSNLYSSNSSKFHTVLTAEMADDSFPTQLISADGEFNAAGLREFINSASLQRCGLSYAVVAIMGPQSSGKSTLLNHLFNTNFTEMDAFKGRVHNINFAALVGELVGKGMIHLKKGMNVVKDNIQACYEKIGEIMKQIEALKKFYDFMGDLFSRKTVAVEA